MTKRTQKIITLTLGVFVLAAIIMLTAFSAIQAASKNSTQTPEEATQTNTPQTSDKKDSYPEPSAELRNRAYPFADDDNYTYFYANIHDYLSTMPEWDRLINYRSLLPQTLAASQAFDIQQDVLFQNIRSWLTTAIYMHPYFKDMPGQITLIIDYRVGIPERAILINATWMFKDDESVQTHLPKVYWDQIRATLANIN